MFVQKAMQNLRREERGITLIALIITIIILVILAAVSINAAYNSGIINYAVNGTENYIEGAKKESNNIENLENSFGKVMNKIEAITSNIYVKLYDYGTEDDYTETVDEQTVNKDGYTLVFSRYNEDIQGVTKIKDYGDIQYKEFTIDTSNNIYDVPWYNERVNITKVIIADKITPLNTAFWFYKFTNLTTIENIVNLDTSYVTSMRSMFCRCASLTSLDLSHFNTENVTNMYYMFAYCTGLTTLDVSNFEGDKVTDMSYMFCNCTGLQSIVFTKDNKRFNTENVTTMHSMFRGCSTITEIDISCFDVSNVLTAHNMFYQCKNVTKIKLGEFNSYKIESLHSMFNSCLLLTEIEYEQFETGNVSTMQYMFESCKALVTLDLSGFNTGSLTNIRFYV